MAYEKLLHTGSSRQLDGGITGAPIDAHEPIVGPQISPEQLIKCPESDGSKPLEQSNIAVAPSNWTVYAPPSTFGTDAVQDGPGDGGCTDGGEGDDGVLHALAWHVNGHSCSIGVP